MAFRGLLCPQAQRSVGEALLDYFECFCTRGVLFNISRKTMGIQPAGHLRKHVYTAVLI